MPACQAAAPSRTVHATRTYPLRLPKMTAKRSIIDYLADHAARAPDRVLAFYKDQEFTYREAVEKSARCRGALAVLGVKHGDRVALVMSDCPDMMVAMLAVMGL